MADSTKFDPEVTAAFARINARIDQIGEGRHARIVFDQVGPWNISGRIVRDEPLPPMPRLTSSAA